MTDVSRPKALSSNGALSSDMGGHGSETFGLSRQTLRWVWRVVWRGRYIMLGCWLLAIVPTLLVLQQTVPLYTAGATVVVEGAGPSDPLNERFDPRIRVTEYTIRTEVEIASSSSLAWRVIQSLNLDQDPEFNPALREVRFFDRVRAWINPMQWLAALSTPSTDAGSVDSTGNSEVAAARTKTAILSAFLSRLSVDMRRRAHILDIRFTSESGEKAARIANAVANMYVLDRLEASLEEARRVNDWLADRLETLRKDVATAEAAAEQYRAAHGLRRKDDRQGSVSEQEQAEINSRLIIARTDLAQKRARLNQVRDLLRSQGGVETARDVLQSPLIQKLREEEAALQRQVSEAAATYGPRHPEMLAYRSNLEELRRKIAAEIQKIAAALSNDVDVAAADVATMERELEQARVRVNTAGEAELHLQELEREAEATRDLYEAFLARFKKGAGQDRIQQANARVISDAEVPSAASYPKRPVVLMVMTVLSLSVALALVFVLDRLDNAVRSSDEAEELTGLPTLAIVPALHKRSADRMLWEMVEQPRSLLADAVRGLRISLDLGAPPRPSGRAHVVVVTSSVPKEGKTFVAMGLALMGAKTGERVLVVDGDVHRPRLHELVDQPNDKGFVQLLAGEALPDEVIRRNVLDNLDFLPAGRLAHVADLISEGRGGAVLDDLARRYDRIVVDTAPVLAVSDARVLGRLGDQMIYLVHWNSTPRDAIRNGIRLLRDAKVPLHGVVLSRVNQRQHSRYAYGDYGQYYGRYRSYYAD